MPRDRFGRGLCLLLLLCACSDPAPRFLTPATTFAHYRQALSQADADAAWACLTPGYRRHLHDDDLETYRRFLVGVEGRRLSDQVQDLQIIAEVEINARVGYLQFDAATVPPQGAPFFYFLRQEQGWQITTHLDSVFRAELEAAVESGEFALPGSG